MKYQFLDIDGLDTYTKKVVKMVRDKSSVFIFNTFSLFPSVGERNSIYVSRENGKMYGWDDEKLNYYQIGFNDESIDVIDCGGSE